MTNSRFNNFAERFASNATLRLMNDLSEGIEQGDKAFMLGGGNPAHIPEAETIFRNAMLAICEDSVEFSQTFGDYDKPQGHSNFINSLADYLSNKLNKNVRAENIALTNGSQSSFSILFNLFSGRYNNKTSKKILLPITPEYVGYQDTNLQNESIFEAREPRIELIDDHRFKYHIDHAALDIAPALHGAVCLSRPTNPSGNVISDTELATLSKSCHAAGVPLIIDGAYGLPFPGIIFNDATSYIDDNTILCLSLSKLGLPGVRTGIVIANKDIIQLVASANAALSLAPGSVGPALGNALIRDHKLDTIANDIVKPHYQKRLQQTCYQIDREFAGLPYRLHQPEGAIFLWLWLKDLPGGSGKLYELLREKNVYVLDGRHFFAQEAQQTPHANECIRISYAGSEETVSKGITIIAETLKALYQIG